MRTNAWLSFLTQFRPFHRNSFVPLSVALSSAALTTAHVAVFTVSANNFAHIVATWQLVLLVTTRFIPVRVLLESCFSSWPSKRHSRNFAISVIVANAFDCPFAPTPQSVLELPEKDKKPISVTYPPIYFELLQVARCIIPHNKGCLRYC